MRSPLPGRPGHRWPRCTPGDPGVAMNHRRCRSAYSTTTEPDSVSRFSSARSRFRASAPRPRCSRAGSGWDTHGSYRATAADAIADAGATRSPVTKAERLTAASDQLRAEGVSLSPRSEREPPAGGRRSGRSGTGNGCLRDRSAGAVEFHRPMRVRRQSLPLTRHPPIF